jgi:hypothetical protein
MRRQVIEVVMDEEVLKERSRCARNEIVASFRVSFFLIP